MSLETVPQVETAPVSNSTQTEDRALTLVSVCFFLSGLAALLYQTAWMRQFAAVFGTSEPAVAAVLAAYMTGLALGAAAAGRWLTRVRRPVLVYGLLELGIAMGAMALPVGLHFARSAFHQYTGGLAELPDAGGGGQFAFYLAATFVLVLIPTSFMGATLPLLARHVVQRESQIGGRIGGLYAINTVGAVFGTVLAAFFLLPQIGLQATIWAGVAINAVVFLLAIVVAQRCNHESESGESTKSTASVRSWVLPMMACSGAIAFTYEVLWTRLLGHLVGGSVYAFATMLASFLTGIAIGSAIAARKAKTREDAIRGFAAAQFGIAVFSIAIYSTLDLLPGLQSALGAGEDAGVGQNAILAALVLLPSTLCLGATFPFAVRIVAKRAEDAGQASARVFSWNTVGATIGALAAGFLIIPAMQFEGAIRFCVLCNLALAVATYLFSGEITARTRATAFGGLALVAIFFQPSAPTSILTSSPFTSMGGEDDVVWSQVGSSCSAIVVKRGDEYQLRVNGLPQALVVAPGAPPYYGIHNRWLTALPLFARPDAESVCVVGLGGGVALENLPASVKSIDVIELSHEVVEANEFLADLRAVDPLSDPRVNLVQNDARSAFERTTKQWDVIVSQPSHPWTAGASHLFTQEFAELVHNRLQPNGVFLQWVATQSFTMDLLKAYGATLLSEFEYVRLYQSSLACPLFLASDDPIAIEDSALDQRGLLDSDSEYTEWLGINRPEDLAARMTLDTEGLRRLCADVIPNSDDSNRIALRPPTLTNRSGREDIEEQLAPLANHKFDLRHDKVYIVRRLLSLEFDQRAISLASRIEDKAERAHAESLIALRMGDSKLTSKKLFEAQDLSPKDADIAYHILIRELVKGVEINDGKAEYSDRGERARLALSSAGRAVEAAWPHLISEDWSEVERLDAGLASAGPNESSFSLALQLRALWRTRGEFSGKRELELAREAVELIDRSIAIRPDFALLALRVEAGARMDAPDFMLESASFLATLLQRVPSTPGTRRHAQTAMACLHKYAADERIDRGRFEDISFRLNAQIQPAFGGQLVQAK